jgi:hypothetical protein
MRIASEETLQYHCSWDWLIPAVHKCYDMAPETVREINNEGLTIFELGLMTPIGDVYKAVVEYVKWHNANVK